MTTSVLRSVLGNNGYSGGSRPRKRSRGRGLLPILAVLGNLVLAISAFGQGRYGPLQITGALTGTVAHEYLLRIEYPEVVCMIEGRHGPRVIVERGTRQQCWNVVVHEHNRQMGDRQAHATLDESLVIMSRAFGKRFKADAQ